MGDGVGTEFDLVEHRNGHCCTFVVKFFHNDDLLNILEIPWKQKLPPQHVHHNTLYILYFAIVLISQSVYCVLLVGESPYKKAIPNNHAIKCLQSLGLKSCVWHGAIIF